MAARGVVDVIRRRQSAAWFLLGATVATAFIATVAVLLTRQPATAAEAQLAAATSAANLTGPAAAGWTDTIAARQLAAIGLLLDAGQTAAIIDVVRLAALVFALVASLLIFSIARRLSFSAPSAAAATALSAILVGLVQLFNGVGAGVVALAWLALAAVITLTPVGAMRWLAGGAAAVAVLTVPLVAVGLLVLSGHLVWVSSVAAKLPPRRRRALAAALLVGAVVVAVLATGDRALALPSLSAYDVPVTLPLIAAAALIVGLAWWRLAWLRPVCSAVGALLACALVPGTGLGTVATLTLPVVAVLVIALADTVPAAALPGPALVGAVSVLGLVAAASTAAVTLGSPRAEADGTLSGWVAGQLDPAQVVRVDELTAAQLVRDGVAASRLRSIADPAAPADAVVVLGDYRGAPAPDAGPGSVLLARFATGPGRAPSEVLLPGEGQTAAAVRADRAARARFGEALARNPRVGTAADVAAALRAGDVDPRLMTVLAALTAAHDITVAELPTVPGEPPAAARRAAVITMFDDVPTSDPATAQILGQWLARQLPPYTPTLPPRAGGPLRVSFPAPSPLGLLSG